GCTFRCLGPNPILLGLDSYSVDKYGRDSRSEREKNRKKEEEENMAAFLSQRKTNTICVHKNLGRKEKKPTLKPRFMEEPVNVVSTEMIDEGKEHAKTEDPHEDVRKLEKDGDKAMM
nr:hypothetical protein [Tanacetum cinerariifolium]